MSTNKQKKIVFSVSKKYQDIFDLLEKVPNKSEFICSAIMEKISGEKQIDDDELQQRMKTILAGMIVDRDILLIPAGASVEAPTSEIVSSSATGVIPAQETLPRKIADKDEIRDVVGKW